MANVVRVLLRRSSLIVYTWEVTYCSQTSDPVPSSSKSLKSSSGLNTFERYYNFHFGSLDCISYGDACDDHDIEAFPTFVLYKDGKEIKRFEDRKDMENLSNFVENALESIKPGSRPVNGFRLPEPGATSVETGVPPDVPLGKDKNAAAGAAAGQQHMDSVNNANESPAVASSTLSVTKVLKPTKPTATPNSAGTSIPLTAESFQKLVTTTQDPWFIKFYAPWCHHCQALAPNWLQMSKELKGKLNIGEVNCDVESRLCKDVRVKGYPTIHFFRGGERVEYDGLRGLGDLVSYAKKALDVGSGVAYVDAAGFKEMEETEEVIFVYFYDRATTSEDFEALERLTLSLIGHAKLVKTDSAVLADRFKIHTWPRLLVSRDGRPSYYTALAPKDMRDYRQVLDWMRTVWLPIVPELTASNSREIMRGRLVVLGILSREHADEFISDKREIKNAALEWMDKETHAFQLERQEQRDTKQLRIEEAEDRNDQRALRAAKSIRIQISEEDRRQVGFAWVDGVFWERWIRTTYGIEVKDGERVVINDEDVSFRPLGLFERRNRSHQYPLTSRRANVTGIPPPPAPRSSPPALPSWKPSRKSSPTHPKSLRSTRPAPSSMYISRPRGLRRVIPGCRLVCVSVWSWQWGTGDEGGYGERGAVRMEASFNWMGRRIC